MPSCKFMIHNWSKWSRPTQGYSQTKVQWRICQDCGKVKYRKIQLYDGQILLSDANKALDEVENKDEL